MASHDFWEWCDDFFGKRVYSTTEATNSGHNWIVTDTSSAGTPLYEDVNNDNAVKIGFDNTSEIQNVCLSHGDQLSFDIDEIDRVHFRVKLGQASNDNTTSFAIGLASARNDAIDSIAEAALFRFINDEVCVVETDDGTNNNDDVATGKSFSNSGPGKGGYHDLEISFANGTSDVRFFFDGEPVARSTTFDMSNYTAGLQPIMQLQKTADTNTDYVLVDRVYLCGRKR